MRLRKNRILRAIPLVTIVTVSLMAVAGCSSWMHKDGMVSGASASSSDSTSTSQSASSSSSM